MDAQVATPASPTRKLLAGETAAPAAPASSDKGKDKALPTDPAEIWLQSYTPCRVSVHGCSTPSISRLDHMLNKQFLGLQCRHHLNKQSALLAVDLVMLTFHLRPNAAPVGSAAWRIPHGVSGKSQRQHVIFGNAS